MQQNILGWLTAHPILAQGVYVVALFALSWLVFALTRSILLATITAILHDPVPGGGLWAAGPYDASFDCQGEMTLFEGLPVSILVDDTVTPVEPTSFGGVKALYR